VVAPKHVDAGSAATHTSSEGGSLATPTAPQMTDVSPNRCGEPVKPLKGTLAHQGGEEVRGALKKGANAEVEADGNSLQNLLHNVLR